MNPPSRTLGPRPIGASSCDKDDQAAYEALVAEGWIKPERLKAAETVRANLADPYGPFW